MKTRSFALGLAAASALLAQGQSTFYAAYQDGLDAERQGRWKAALSAFQRAVELRPDSAARVITYGNNLLLNYAPYTHLAKCHLELGEVEAGQAALARAAAHNEPKADRDRVAQIVQSPAPPSKALPAEPSRSEAPAPAPVPPPAPAPSQPPAAAQPQPSSPVPGEAPKPSVFPASTVAKSGSGAQSQPPQAAPPLRQEPVAPAAPVPVERPEKPTRWPWILGLTALGGGLLWALRRRATPSGTGDPDRLGPYRIVRLLGRGGFASTYLARHETTGVQVALKRLHPYRQEDPEFLSRFRQEARLGTRLNHPNLVRVVDPGLEEGTPWLAMEYVSGDRLDQRLKQQGRLPLPEVLRIASEIAGAMAHAHELGIIHRDLKPGNVMFEGDRVKVMDFGISRTMDSTTLTTTYAFLGTPRYAAPEAQLKTQVGPAADRYSFGIMLYELLAGAPPFEGETPFEILDQHRSRPLPDLAALRPDLPTPLTELVRKLCAKAPEDRPEDAEILAALEALRSA